MSNNVEDEDRISYLRYNKELADIPACTLDEREEFIKWLDHIQSICMHVFYATAPEELWQDKDVTNFVLIGQPDKYNTEIPRGMYCVDLPPIFDAAYRNPIALAFAHLAQAPENFKFVPSAISIVLPKPTAHERFSAKMFFKKLINDNTENQDLREWASKLN
jgi:hypothetical protein